MKRAYTIKDEAITTIARVLAHDWLKVRELSPDAACVLAPGPEGKMVCKETYEQWQMRSHLPVARRIYVKLVQQGLLR